METKVRTKVNIRAILAIGLPVLLTGLFYLLKDRRPVMDFWVYRVMGPFEQVLGRMWSVLPISVMEIFIALFLAGNVVWLALAAVLVIRQRRIRGLLRRLAALAAVWLWLWCGVCWLWNAAYNSSSFTERSGLKTAPYSVEELTAVTRYFAQHAAELSGQVARDGENHFAEPLDVCFEQGVSVYDALAAEFPILVMKSVQAKPLLFSRLQSILGFTGMYFPFTGEANVNVDAPACLIPATIAHEMSHQRMVSSELEANFVGIAACVTCDDVVFQYSGYLMGLVQLCNALYSVDAQAWQDIADQTFTPELATDWTDNNTYWTALESPVEDAAGNAYDSFLKGNGQDLGMRSYGACVDLLVAYFGPAAEES
ncbi:MAG: DUF3810 domain-containing protein [Lawsonibacter sp.]|nr:DUF3810 domain-containing protein [Lawsonibacter sp.]